MEDKEGDGDFEASAFEALEKDFQEILQELVGDKSLEHFRQEYEKLHRALKKSHESEKHLIKKCRELNAEIVSNAVKVQTALKLSQEDQATITSLKKEIERAWKMVETSHEKEQRAKDTIQSLKSEIGKLGRLVEQGAGLSINQENMVNQLVQEKNDLIKHRDMLTGQVGQLVQQNGDLTTRVGKLEQERQSGNNELSSLKEQLEQRLADADKEQKRKEKLDKELKELRQAMEARQSEINAKKEDANRLTEHIQQMENNLKHEKQTIESLNNRHETLENQKESLKKGQKEEENTHLKTKEENEDLKGQLERRQDEINHLTNERKKINKSYDATKKKQVAGQAETKKLEESRNVLKTEINGLVKEMEGLKKQAETDSKQIIDMLHERDILNKNVMKADDRTKMQVDLVKRHEGQANTLGKDLQRWKTELQLKLFRIHELDKLREKYASELGIAKTRYEIACEWLKSRDNHMAQLKKSITDLKARLSQQKNLYEAVRTDKNLYSKNLTEATEEIGEMVKKFKVMHHQIEQLKEEIKEKDKQLITEHFEHQFISKESDKTKENLEKHSKQQKRLQQVVDLQQQEITKLEATIQEAEVERQNQRKEFEGVISERNILGTQLIRRNEELALLYEKIKIQESTLKKGETQYRNRLEEIKKQKDGIRALKDDLVSAGQQAENIDDHKKEVYHLQRELLQERTKVKALSEELENPMNVHRWRKLEGSDPAMYELIQKVRTLQKRLIKKTEEVVKKDDEIQEKERLHRELTGILEKQPGPEVMEQLEMFQDNLAAKLNQMKAMQSELKTYQAQVGDYKDEIDRLTRELQEVKKKYFEQKKREQMTQEAQRGDTKAIHPKPTPQVRFTGGGFSLAH
jgi:chromosome segregation ATPase